MSKADFRSNEVPSVARKKELNASPITKPRIRAVEPMLWDVMDNK